MPDAAAGLGRGKGEGKRIEREHWEAYQTWAGLGVRTKVAAEIRILPVNPIPLHRHPSRNEPGAISCRVEARLLSHK